MVQLSEPDWEYDRIHSWSLIRDWYVDMILQRGSHLMRSIGGSKRVVVAPCCNSTSYWINISSQWLLVEFRWISSGKNSINSTIQYVVKHVSIDGHILHFDVNYFVVWIMINNRSLSTKQFRWFTSTICSIGDHDVNSIGNSNNFGLLTLRKIQRLKSMA
jgi:hypothetical protein